MAGSEKLFRKAALEKLSSPERLDVMMQITSPAGWLALLFVGFVLVLVVIWSVVGWIPIKVGGQGILIRGGAVLAITSESGGRIGQLLVSPGDEIKRDDVLAKISQDSMMLQIENKKALLADLQRQRGALSTGSIEQQLRNKLAQQEALVARGLLTRSSVMATQEQLNAIRQQSAGGQTQIDEIRRGIKELETSMAGASQITSPYSGRVIEVSVSPGELIGPGSRILSLEELQREIEVILYIPASEGKKVRPGMQVRVSPTTIKAEEFGFMLGEVIKVSDFPVSPEGLARVLRNDNLVQAIAGGGAPIEIRVKLFPAKTPSGFKWSSANGPPLKVYSGTLCAGSVVVERKHPIDYVIPIFKNAVGG